MNINSSVYIEINDTIVTLEGVRKNLFVSSIIRIENPRNESLLADERILGEYFYPTSKRNFRMVILDLINFFIRKDLISREVESDLRKLVNQNIYKEKIANTISQFKNNFSTIYDGLDNIIINRKNVVLNIPNTQELKIKLIFLFTHKYRYGVHLVIAKNELSFNMARWRKVLNTNSIIKQITDWEVTAIDHSNSELFFNSKMELKSYLIANKSKINSLLLDINDYTKK